MRQATEAQLAVPDSMRAYCLDRICNDLMINLAARLTGSNPQ